MANILIVDDEETFARNAAKFLEKGGHSVRVALTAADGLDVCAAFGPDLVVLDYRLPDMDGLMVIGRIRRLDPEVPILMITGHGSIELAVDAMKAGANDLKTSPTAHKNDISWCGRLKDRHFVYTPRNSGTDDGPFENPALNKFVVGLALYLLNVFSSRLLQLLLGGICVVVVLGVTRFCFLRWRRATNKTF